MATARGSGSSDGPTDRLALWCGPVSILVSAAGILTATLIAPSFSWTGNALSDLGAAGASTALLFNGTLILTGVLGLPFAFRAYRGLRNRIRRIGVVLFGASMVTLALVGVFALPSPYHGPVAVSFFLLFTLGIAVDGLGAIRDGSGAIRRGRRRDGVLSVGLAAVHVLAWFAWGASGLAGVALPEMVGTVAIWIWVLRRFAELRE